MTSSSNSILVVDDEAHVRAILTQFLRLQGHRVVTAADGEEALVVLRHTAIDLVLLDMMMPRMTGLEALRRIKADPELGELPVVIVSSETDVESIAACIKTGADDYLPKPFNPVILEARISACLERRRLRVQERAYRGELERLVAERTTELRQSEERYALAARGANDGLWDWNLQTNRIVLSPRWKDMLGYHDDEIGTDPEEWLGRIHPDDRERLEVKLSAHYRRLITHFEHEYRVMHRDGEYRWMLSRGLAVWDGDGQAVRIAGSQTDISERKRAEQQLLHDALHDALTGLPNRVLFLERVRHALAHSQRNPDYRFAVLFLDLDRFKVINDSLGHAVGDQLLQATARRLEGCVRSGDTVARLGGDEFTVLVEDIRDDDAVFELAGRIQHAVGAPLRLTNQDVISTASIGVTTSALGYDAASDIIRDADTAMYHAKTRGKAQTVRFDRTMHAAVMEQLQIESALRAAIDRDELRLHYQPIVALDTGRIAGFEALLRWQHPQRGLLPPAAFLHVAEDTGLIVPIGWWALRAACRQLRVWQQQHNAAQSLWVTVNLSAKQLAQPDVPARVLGILTENQLPPANLKLEITETTLIEQDAHVIDVLQQLRAAGVRVCMDDFGTGYSSLSYLQRLPVDVLKIDRSFARQIGAEQRNEIVQTIITLAKVLGLETVAEGTETVEQVEHLREMHCQYAQGWLFSRALAPDAAEVMLASEVREVLAAEVLVDYSERK